MRLRQQQSSVMILRKRLISSASEPTISASILWQSIVRILSLTWFFDPHHPAVLRMISLVMENAHKAGIWAGICGELGADQSLTKEFLAMGVDELSVSPGSILPLRKIILETNVTDYKAGKEC